MKKSNTFIMLLSLIVLSWAFILLPANAQEEAKEAIAPQEEAQEKAAAPEGAKEKAAGLNISRMVLCESVENREPVGETDLYPASTEKAYVFLEAKDIAEDTNVSFVWHFGENEMAKVDLTLRAGSRWRTYSSKNLAGLKGDWNVELQDTNGTVLKAIAFRVE